jgi:hypothetical protein
MNKSVTSLAGLLSQGSLAKGVLGSVQAYSEEGGNAQAMGVMQGVTVARIYGNLPMISLK